MGWRENILENIAASADMPAIILKEETFAEGFGEGTEDAKHVAQFVDRERITMDPLKRYFDKIVQHRAWNPNFYETIQNLFPETYGDVKYETAFREWQNSFVAEWPNLLEEPDSEKSKIDDVQAKGHHRVRRGYAAGRRPGEQGAIDRMGAGQRERFRDAVWFAS